MAEKKDYCPDCGGTGFLIDYVAACCMNPNEDGSCCNNPIAEPVQSECPRCGATGFIPKVVPEPVEGVTDEDILTPIQNALYSTGKFTTDDCDNLSDGILEYIRDAGFEIAKASINKL